MLGPFVEKIEGQLTTCLNDFAENYSELTKDNVYFGECFTFCHKSKGWQARSMKFYWLTQIMCLLNAAKWEVCMLNTEYFINP